MLNIILLKLLYAFLSDFYNLNNVSVNIKNTETDFQLLMLMPKKISENKIYHYWRWYFEKKI